MQNVFLHVNLLRFSDCGDFAHSESMLPQVQHKVLDSVCFHQMRGRKGSNMKTTTKEPSWALSSQIIGIRWGEGEATDMLPHFRLISHSLTTLFPTKKDRSNEDSTTPVKPSQTDRGEEFCTSYRHIHSKFSWKCHSCYWAPSLWTSALMSMPLFNEWSP